jgi:ribosomal protein S18 acetylase RimI-like enzyme
MRIRTYRSGDIPALVHVQQTSARFDGQKAMDEAEMAHLLQQSMTRFGYNIFLITDDDDELITWGQGENLEGVEGELVGYTILSPGKDERGYRFHCYGTVLPEHRHRGAGHALLLCALNHARMQSIDYIVEARQRNLPISFEVELPAHDLSTEHLASTFELEKTDEPAAADFYLYRTTL